MTGQREVVRCRYLSGVLKEIEIERLNEFVTPGALLEQRFVRVNGRVFVCKYVSRAAGHRDPRLYDLLDNEVRAGTRLGHCYPGRYPAELAQLVAYNIDAEEPFLLLREYAGVPMAEPAHRFKDAERRQVERGLARALCLTSEAGVVHGAVTLDALRWDEGRVQLVDFEFAERVGEPRRRRASAIRSPEQAAGTGQVHACDDLWAAAVLIRRLHLGSSTDVQPDRRHDPDRLRGLLDPILGNALEQRLSAVELLGRLHGDNHLPEVADPDARLAQGRALYDAVAERKGGAAKSSEDTRARKRGRRFLPFLSTTVLVSAAIVAMAVSA